MMQKALIQGAVCFASPVPIFCVLNARTQTDAPQPPTPATLPGAKSLPYRENSAFKADFDASTDQLDLKILPADKAARGA